MKKFTDNFPAAQNLGIAPFLPCPVGF